MTGLVFAFLVGFIFSIGSPPNGVEADAFAAYLRGSDAVGAPVAQPSGVYAQLR